MAVTVNVSIYCCVCIYLVAPSPTLDVMSPAGHVQYSHPLPPSHIKTHPISSRSGCLLLFLHRYKYTLSTTLNTHENRYIKLASRVHLPKQNSKCPVQAIDYIQAISDIVP